MIYFYEVGQIRSVSRIEVRLSNEFWAKLLANDLPQILKNLFNFFPKFQYSGPKFPGQELNRFLENLSIIF